MLSQWHNDEVWVQFSGNKKRVASAKTSALHTTTIQLLHEFIVPGSRLQFPLWITPCTLFKTPLVGLLSLKLGLGLNAADKDIRCTSTISHTLYLIYFIFRLYLRIEINHCARVWNNASKTDEHKGKLNWVRGDLVVVTYSFQKEQKTILTYSGFGNINCNWLNAAAK